MTSAMREDHHEYLDIHFLTPTPFEKAGAAWPIRIGHNIAKPNYHIGPRIKPSYYLMIVLEGQGTFHQSGRTYPLRSGDLFCLFPQVTHEYYTDPEHPLRKAFFAFDGKHALHLLERIGLTPQCPYAPAAAATDSMAAMQQLRQQAAEGASSDLARLGLFYKVFELLEATSQASAGGTARTQDDAWLQQGKAYIDIHYAEGISIEQISDSVGVDRSHFTKTFRKVYGMPPMQYIQQLKMNEAKLLLGESDYKLAEIARSIGYPDVFSFSKAFKRLIGIPPQEYRLQARAESRS